MVWLPHGRSYGFSGGWRGFAIDLVSPLCQGQRTACSWRARLPQFVSVKQTSELALLRHTPTFLRHAWRTLWLPSAERAACLALQKLFPGDAVVVETVPTAQHVTTGTRFSLTMHIFR